MYWRIFVAFSRVAFSVHISKMSEELGERERYLELAKLAECAELFEDMRGFLKKVIELNPVLSEDTRTFFMTAYKNLVGARRLSWHTVYSLEKREQDERKRRVMTDYRKKIKKLVHEICDEVLCLLKEQLLSTLPTVDDAVCKEDGRVVTKNGTELADKIELVYVRAFYYKMRADYLRYKVEVAVDDDRRGELEQIAEDAYMAALAEAKLLGGANAVVLGLALNLSVFYYEIRRNSLDACSVAKKAYDVALSELDTIPDEHYKETVSLMEVLRDNLQLWTTEDGDDLENSNVM